MPINIIDEEQPNREYKPVHYGNGIRIVKGEGPRTIKESVSHLEWLKFLKRQRVLPIVTMEEINRVLNKCFEQSRESRIKVVKR